MLQTTNSSLCCIRVDIVNCPESLILNFTNPLLPEKCPVITFFLRKNQGHSLGQGQTMRLISLLESVHGLVGTSAWDDRVRRGSYRLLSIINTAVAVTKLFLITFCASCLWVKLFLKRYEIEPAILQAIARFDTSCLCFQVGCLRQIV